MKILLVDNLQNFQTNFVRYSLGLLSLATILKEKDYHVEILNFEYLFLKEILNYDIDPAKNFDTMTGYILEKNPGIVGFTGMCNTFHNSLTLAGVIKKAKRDIKVILGGPHVSMVPEKVLETYDWIDLICVGEGENKIEDIVKGIEENNLDNVPGIVYRKGEVVIRNNDKENPVKLDELPFLNYDLIPYIHECAYFPLETGRGCPYNCSYCASSKFWNRKFRVKSIERIMKEIDHIKNFLGKDKISLDFPHDNFTLNYDFAMKLCKALEGQNIEWECFARIESLDEALVSQMARAGCTEMFIGIESGSPSVQKSIHKNLALEKAGEITDIVLKHNIDIVASFIYGFPGETEEDLNMTLNMIYSFLKKGLYKCQLHALSVMAGTELFERYLDDLVLADYCSDMAHSSNLEFCSSFIKENKELFSHCYILKNSLLEKYPLLEKFIFYIFILLYRYFPRTINLLVKTFKGNILELYKDFISDSGEKFESYFRSKEYLRDFLETLEFIKYMLSFLEGYIKNKDLTEARFKVLASTFDIENLKFSMKYYSAGPKIRVAVKK